MTTDYAALRRENQLEYGRAIGRIGKMLLEDRYDKRTHFLYEVLQNAEDALRRRDGWTGSHAVTFHLSRDALRIAHFGAPFTADDVRGICGIDESTKDVTAIGRFGIGFKSVYAFTTRPEVHSGDEDFVIHDYVLPSVAAPCARDPNETVILLPLEADDPSAFAEIAKGLEELGAEALLFLKHVDQIVWTVENGNGGRYQRIPRGDGVVREVQLVAGGAHDRSYLLFSRPVAHDGQIVGQAELAFLTAVREGRQVIQSVSDARLAVFFPTVLPTHTGFLVQGPYQTTPSRDNIPLDKPWNVELAAITGELLVDALRHLRDAGLLDVAALKTLPLERQKLAGSLFAPLFERTIEAFQNERLVPTATGRFAKAADVRLARAQDVRDLFGPKQLGRLLGLDTHVAWVTADITADRAPQLRTFLLQELKVTELTLNDLLPRLNAGFLAEQSDAWMLRLYKLLASQPAMWRGRARDLALIRLEDGTHVPLMRHGLTQAFLPSDGKTGFPTVRAALCTAETLKFLQGLGLTRPDPVEDVIRNLLPKYREETIDESNYDDDIARMVRAFQTDSAAQRTKLVAALKVSSIVMATNAATDEEYMSTPDTVYLASARMVDLFRGVEEVSLLDNRYDCLRGEKVREMLEACGATRILRTIKATCDVSVDDRRAARRAAGWESSTGENPIEDLDVAGLDGLLQLLPSLPDAAQRDRARQLWEALAELVDRRGPAVLTVDYSWNYHQKRSTTLDAGFIRKLNATPWIPDRGELRRPSEVLFDALGWPAHPLLGSKIQFKPPAIAALAREVGIDPDVLDELKRLGLTDLDQLRTRLNLDAADETGSMSGGPSEPADDPTANDERSEDDKSNSDADDSDGGRGDHAGGGTGGSHERGSGSTGGTRSSRNGSGTQREFISYVGVRHGEDGADPDGLTQSQRMRLEEQAITRILQHEPLLERTAAGNEGYDLVETDTVGEPLRWIEVKAMTGSLADRPVGLSQPQLEHARRGGDQYWLYVVEHAADDQRARILKIRNPFGAAGTFTFDRGWEAIAIVHDCAADLPAAAA